MHRDVRPGRRLLGAAVIGGAGAGWDAIEQANLEALAVANKLFHANTLKVEAKAAVVQVLVPVQLPSYTVSGLPSASPAAQLVYVSDEAGGATLAFSDGAAWRRVQDRVVVS